jgi:hypothetical protein
MTKSADCSDSCFISLRPVGLLIATAKLACAALGSSSLLSNLQLRGEKLEFSLRSPFDLMVEPATYEEWLVGSTPISEFSYSIISHGFSRVRFGFLTHEK